MQISRRGFQVLAGLLAVVLSANAARADRWHDQRQQLRENRASFLSALESNHAQRAAAVETRVRAFFDEVEARGWACEPNVLWGMVAGLERMDASRLGDLPGRARQLIASMPQAKTKRPNPQFTAALRAARKEITDETYSLLRKAANVGEVQAAVELMEQVLLIDPDYKAIRSALGQVKVADKHLERIGGGNTSPRKSTVPEVRAYNPDRNWFSKFDAQMAKKGYVWSNRFGWILFDHQDRYDQGMVYDLQRKKWFTLANANAYHSQPRRDWVLLSEHVQVQGTCDLDKLAQVVTDLEAMYDEIFSVYALFFADGGKYDPLQLALGLAEHKPMQVWVYRTRQEYLQRSGAVSWSGGIFRPSNGTSYFYGGPSTTMYHEFTHQVLHVMTGGNQSPSWLTESIAEYTETVEMVEGELRFRGARYTDALSLEKLFSLESGAAWSRHAESDEPSAYAAAGSVATFCMKAEDGRYAADFIDFLRDSYRGKTRGRQLWDYLGLSRNGFTKAYHTWGRDR